MSAAQKTDSLLFPPHSWTCSSFFSHATLALPPVPCGTPQVLAWLKQWDPLVFGAMRASTSANVLSALRNHPMAATSGGGRGHAGAGRGTWRGSGGGRGGGGGGGGWHGGRGGRGGGGGGWHGGSKPSYGSSRPSGSYSSGAGGSYRSSSTPGYTGGGRSSGGGSRWGSKDSGVGGPQASSFSGRSQGGMGGASGAGAECGPGAARRRRTPQAKVLLLCGAPGLGKTTLAHVAAKHCGYHVVEV